MASRFNWNTATRLRARSSPPALAIRLARTAEADSIRRRASTMLYSHQGVPSVRCGLGPPNPHEASMSANRSARKKSAFWTGLRLF